ncbi:MAG: hypothetical protein CSA26_03535 [Desulfobacterales bacterium]|nr:MAG: hypothetical protein CSA26_03535 [Desulfobacterales bacterium]
MKTIPRKSLLLVLFLMFFGVLQVHAITLTVDQQSAPTGTAISFTIVVGGTGLDIVPEPFHYINVDFGDGVTTQIKSNVDGGPSGDGAFETYVLTHTYKKAGRYRVKIDGVERYPADIQLVPPRKVRQIIEIYSPLADDLRDGIVGEEYEERLRTTDGGRVSNPRLRSGKLPPGLELDRYGTITGIPSRRGTFRFTVDAMVNGSSRTRELEIVINPGNLQIKVVPETLAITGQRGGGHKVTFNVVQPTIAVNETIRSNRGEFLLGGQVVGSYNRPLTINLNQQNPSATETITVPPRVFQAMQKAGSNRVHYVRSFRPYNFRPGKAEAKVTVRTPASGELRITKMRLYFEQNNRSLIVVERNERNLTGAVDIHYNGTGLLKGYWQVGDRKLQHIQKHLFYGKVITLKTPRVPPLPTYSEGAYRLQFIVTEPETARVKIDFPEALYHVEVKRAVVVTAIQLQTPKKHDEFNDTVDLFSWSEVKGAKTYAVEFFEQDAEKPFFIAYSKVPSYSLPPKLQTMKFKAGRSYEWQVKAYNAEEIVNGESEKRVFSVSDQTSFIPGQVLFLVNNDSEGEVLIKSVVGQYPLQILEQAPLAALDQIMVVCSTDADVPGLITDLQLEEGLKMVQPNYVFSTLGDAVNDPLRSMQQIDDILDLDRIHRQLTGKDVLVAIIDTGIDLDHLDLGHAIRDYRNFVSDSDYVGEIHGTAVAGIIAAASNDFGILGIAPDVHVLALRACSQNSKKQPAGVCVSGAIAKAIDAAITARADIVNMSLGTTARDSLIASLIRAGSNSGLLFTAPVGNDPDARELSFPASDPHVTSVAGFDSSGKPLPNETVALNADVVAPGANLFSAIPGNKHNFVDGTSFATAAVSGILALGLEAGNNDMMNGFPAFNMVATWKESVSTFIGMK